MEVLFIKGTHETPEVTFDAVNQIFKISGRSSPENVNKFYTPILDWFNAYEQKPNQQTVFDFQLHYYNTASAKLLLTIMLRLEKICDKGYDVLIRWFFPNEDDDMEEAGEDYKNIVNVPFELVRYDLENV